MEFYGEYMEIYGSAMVFYANIWINLYFLTKLELI